MLKSNVMVSLFVLGPELKGWFWLTSDLTPCAVRPTREFRTAGLVRGSKGVENQYTGISILTLPGAH